MCNSHLSAGCLNYFISVSLPLLPPLSLPLSPRFIIWPICGWVTNPGQVPEPIYLLILIQRDTLLPITALCKAMSFSLLKCMSITSTMGTRRGANRKHRLSAAEKNTHTHPCFHLHLISQSFTDLWVINNEHWRVDTCSHPSPPLLSNHSQGSIRRRSKKTENSAGGNASDQHRSSLTFWALHSDLMYKISPAASLCWT